MGIECRGILNERDERRFLLEYLRYGGTVRSTPVRLRHPQGKERRERQRVRRFLAIRVWTKILWLRLWQWGWGGAKGFLMNERQEVEGKANMIKLGGLFYFLRF